MAPTPFAQRGTMTVDPPTYTLMLADAGPNKAEVILMIRTIRPDLNLPAVKALVEAAPQPLLQSIDYWHVDDMIRRLEHTGATIEKIDNAAETRG
jgi:large subunit ribosomal protein L7/L12